MARYPLPKLWHIAAATALLAAVWAHREPAHADPCESDPDPEVVQTIWRTLEDADRVVAQQVPWTPDMVDHVEAVSTHDNVEQFRKAVMAIVRESSGSTQLDALVDTERHWIYALFEVRPTIKFMADQASTNAVAIRGEVTLQFRPGEYGVQEVSSPDGTILLGQNLLKEALGMDGIRPSVKLGSSGAILTVSSHEAAHIVQFQKDTKFAAKSGKELHADFLAGWFVARRILLDASVDASDKPEIYAHIEAETRRLFQTADAPHGMSGESDHGTSDQRFLAFKAGAFLGGMTTGTTEATHIYTLEQTYELGRAFVRRAVGQATPQPTTPRVQSHPFIQVIYSEE